jgi:hypothetical protein
MMENPIKSNSLPDRGSHPKNFLDLTIYISNGRIETNMFRNPVSKSDMYLNYFSAHPSSTRNSIPYSLALRIVRNCSVPSQRDKEFEDLRIGLVGNSNYPSEVVDAAFSRAKSQDRVEVLKQRKKENEDELGRTILVTPFHRTLLSLPHILRECATPLIGLNETFDSIFEKFPIVAWNRGPTLKQAFAPSKLCLEDPPAPGNHACQRKKCVTCNDIMSCKSVSINNYSRKVIGSNDCDTSWVVYALCCVPCNLWYIGKTYTSFRVRYSNHRSKINKKIRDFSDGSESTVREINFEPDQDSDGSIYLWKHFCLNHSDISTLKWMILHKIGKDGYDPSGGLLKWEHAYIDAFRTKWPLGLNNRS